MRGRYVDESGARTSITSPAGGQPTEGGGRIGVRWWSCLIHSERAATMIEYAILMSTIAVVASAAVVFLWHKNGSMYAGIGDGFSSAGTSTATSTPGDEDDGEHDSDHEDAGRGHRDR